MSSSVFPPEAEEKGKPIHKPTYNKNGQETFRPYEIARENRQATFDKWLARFKDNPFIFIFLGLTCAALVRGLGAFASADRRTSQMMMRYRVGFQFCTVGAFVGGIYYKAYSAEITERQKKLALTREAKAAAAAGIITGAAADGGFPSIVPTETHNQLR